MPNLFRILAIAILAVTSFGACAQTDSTAHVLVVQLTGVVVEGDSLGPSPFATVYRARDQRGTITDEYGFFAIPARVGDTVRFSAIGLVQGEIVVPDLTGQEMPDRMSVVLPLGRDTVIMEAARIYPWPSRERFKEEFLALRMEADARERARRNLNFDPMAMYDRMAELGSTPEENFRVLQARQAEMAGYQGGVMPVSLLNPLAWGQFINALRSGDYRKR
jgi:hypothetical protein